MNKGEAMLKALKEITVWEGDIQPNHIYLMQGDKALGYIKWGVGKPEYFKNPMQIDKRGRKFETLKTNPFTDYVESESEIDEDAPISGKNIVKVAGSKGAVYEVDVDARTCTCPAAKWQRGECKHVKQVCGEKKA